MGFEVPIQGQAFRLDYILRNFQKLLFSLITHFSLKENEESFETFYLSI
jgi:hypothetical protein